MLFFYLMRERYKMFSNPDTAALLKTLPFAFSFFLGVFLNTNLLAAHYMDRNPKNGLRAAIAFALLTFQMSMSMYIGYIDGKYSSLSWYARPLICSLYPAAVGSTKLITLWIAGSKVNIDECFEFFSLAYAAMPYRLLYLSVEFYSTVALIFLVKLCFKIYTFCLQPFIREQMKL